MNQKFHIALTSLCVFLTRPGNTEILVNSVVIILVTHIDELMYGILMSISPSWVASMTPQQAPQSLTHHSYPQQPPSQRSSSPKPRRQTSASASSENDEDDDNFADDDDDVDSLKGEQMPLEKVGRKPRGGVGRGSLHSRVTLIT